MDFGFMSYVPYLSSRTSSLDIRAIYAYTLRSSSSSLLYFALLPFSLDFSDLRLFSLYLGGFGNFAIIRSSDPHLKPPKDSEKRRKYDKSKEKVNSAKDNSDDDDDLKVYASMARMSNDDKRENKYYGDSSQLTNWVLDSGATCHMTPEVTDIIPGALEDTDKFI